MRCLPLLALLAVAACAPDPADVAPAPEPADDLRSDGPIDVDMDGLSISSDLDGTPVQAITTTGGEVELGLTDQVLYSRLSEETQAEIASDMEAESKDQKGLGGRIARAVTGAVAEGLGTSVQVPLAEIRDVRVENGRLVIEMADGEPSPFEHSSTDDKPLLEQFSARDAERLAAAFDKITAGR